MKNIEAVIPQPSVQATVQELYRLDVREITVEPIKVFKKDLHRKMIHRGCEYEQNFVIESKIRFAVSDEASVEAESIVAHAAHD